MELPRQSKTVHIEVLSDELCLYDWQRKDVHALNPTAAMVWQLCDGQTSPAQMAAHLRANLETDLDTPQSEALVWTSLEPLRKANLLEGEIAKPAGRPILTRRQMLKALGGAAAGAALLPMVSSIVAPGPVAAQSPVPVTQIVLYDAGGRYNGDLVTVGGFPGNGRAGADAICAASANRPAGYTNFRAFISVSTTDEIRDMPSNYGVPANLPIVGQNGTQLAPNWAGLPDGTIDATLQAVGSGGAYQQWWSGSTGTGDGSFRADADGSCSGWTNGLTGAASHGNDNSVAVVGVENWNGLVGLYFGNCDFDGSVKCIAF